MAAESVIESLELNNLRGIDVLVKADPDEDGNLTEGKLSGTGDGLTEGTCGTLGLEKRAEHHKQRKSDSVRQ